MLVVAVISFIIGGLVGFSIMAALSISKVNQSECYKGYCNERVPQPYK